MIALRLFYALAWAERLHLLPAVATSSPRPTVRAVVQEKPKPDHRMSARPIIGDAGMQ